MPHVDPRLDPHADPDGPEPTCQPYPTSLLYSASDLDLEPGPPAQLNIDYQSGGAFSAFVSAALGQTVTFNPYADNLRFLLGAYIMEDVIPTAWEVGDQTPRQGLGSGLGLIPPTERLDFAPANLQLG